jgi:hypothetical protein
MDVIGEVWVVIRVEVVSEMRVVGGALRLVAGRAVVDCGVINRWFVGGKSMGICGCGGGLWGANRIEAV